MPSSAFSASVLAAENPANRQSKEAAKIVFIGRFSNNSLRLFSPGLQQSQSVCRLALYPLSRLNTVLRLSASAVLPCCQSGVSSVFFDACLSASIDSCRVFESKQALIGIKSGLNKGLVLIYPSCLTLHLQMVPTITGV